MIPNCKCLKTVCLKYINTKTNWQGVKTFPAIKTAADAISIYVIVILAINLVSVVLQCGVDQCHTFGYQLLGGPTTGP